MSGLSRIVKTITSVAFPFVMIYGIYIIAHGHLTPGGGFQGGAIVASGCAMILVAYGSVWTMGKIKEKNLSILESLGAIGFISLALFGLFIVVDGVPGFFNNFLANTNAFFGTSVNLGETAANINTGGVIPFMNFAVGLKVAVGLFAIVLIMAYASSIKEGNK